MFTQVHDLHLLLCEGSLEISPLGFGLTISVCELVLFCDGVCLEIGCGGTLSLLYV